MQPKRLARRFALMRALPLVALSLIAASAVQARVETGDQQLARLLAGRTEGKASDCLPLFRPGDSETIKGIGIAYRDGRTLWLSRFDHGCDAGPTDTIVTSTPASHVCRGDIVRVFDQMTHMEHGACVFGPFVPYTKPK